MTKSDRTALRTLLLCQGVLVAGLALSFPFMTLYLHQRRGLPMGMTGLAVSLSVVATAVGQGLGGELSDLWGCKRVMSASLAGRVVLMILMALAIALAWPVFVIVTLLVCAGFFGSFYDPAVRAWIAGEHPAAGRVRAYGQLRVATNAAWAVGPAVGGLMAGVSYALMFGVTSALCLVCLGLLVWVVPDAPASRTGEGFAWGSVASVSKDRRFLEFCGLSVLAATVMAHLVAPLSVHATAHGGLTEPQVGLLFALNGILVVLLQRAATRAISARALTSAAVLGCLLYALGWSWMGFARGWALLAGAMTVVTLGEIVVSPSLQALAANLAPDQVRGRYIGFHGLMTQLGMALGPLLGGISAEQLGGRWVPAPWLAVGALAAFTGWGFSRLGRHLRPAEQGLHPLGVL